MSRANNIPVTMDDDMLRQIDEVAASKGASRSWVMREAIRTGLPMVGSSGLVEVVPVDSELQKDVTTIAEGKGLTRSKVLLESLKIGLPAVNVRLPNKELKGTPEAELFEVFASHDPNSVPIARDLRRALYNAAYLRDIMEQVCRITEAEEKLERERKEAAGEPVPVKRVPSVREQLERVNRVYRWVSKSGKPFGASLGMVGWIPFDTFREYESEMLAEESAAGIATEPKSKVEAPATAATVPTPIPTPSPKPKPARKPRKE